MASIRVLVVDDFEPWRRSVCSMLKGQAELKVVAEATDGWEAIQKAQTLRPVLDLVRPRPSEFEWNGCCEAHTRSRSRRKNNPFNVEQR
jgi:CheY-like chemotaxis protein